MTDKLPLDAPIAVTGLAVVVRHLPLEKLVSLVARYASEGRSTRVLWLKDDGSYFSACWNDVPRYGEGWAAIGSTRKPAILTPEDVLLAPEWVAAITFRLGGSTKPSDEDVSVVPSVHGEEES